MREVPPCTVTECTNFPALPFPVPSNAHNSFGRVSKDGSWAWLAHKSILEIFNTKSKERCGVWYFGASLKSDTFAITAIEELCSAYLPFPCLVVGLDTPEGGLVSLFNVKTSKVISSIRLSNKVTALAVVSGAGGATMETHPLSPQLRFFFGIIAVGTEGGNVLLIDLCLDGENYTDENRPNKALVVHKQTHNLPAKREHAIANSQHLCILLNDTNFKLDVFEYRNNRTLIATLPADDVIVTSIKYLRNLAVLVVGFNFGGMQLWNLQQLHLEFSLPVHLNQPLVHFAFQEPENDPRNFCFLWAIHGYYQGEYLKPESVTTATLYCFAYAKKDWIPRYGYLYRTLESVKKSLEYTLSKDPYNCLSDSPTNYSRLITCEVIPQPALRLDAEESIQSDECGFAEDLSLCVMAWENWSGAQPSSSCLVLFDINQWYHAQVPSNIRCNFGTLCSYLGVFALNEISTKMRMDPLMAISVTPNSLSRFKCPLMSEEMFFPSSFSFKIGCLSSASFLQATYLGVQRQILLEMNMGGPNVLIEPKKLYDWCLAGGLISPINEIASGSQFSANSQREILLTLALENNMIFFLDRCVQTWRNTEFLLSGCSSKFLLDWVWKTVTKIKTSIDKLCLPLFDCSGQVLDESGFLLLRAYESRLKHLADILLLFQHLPGPSSELGQRELQLKKSVVNAISTYLHILVWFCDCKLLPEYEEGCEYGEDEVAYPISRFQKTYAYRRSELQNIHSSIGMTDMLMIDGLVEECGPLLIQVWEKKGGTNTYPPPSIYAAISSYLLDGPSLCQKHVLMCYLLLDMTAFLADRQTHLLEKLSTFGSSNNVPLQLCKLAHAFWHLDHCDFETALNSFLDPLVLAADISGPQHVRILKSFLFQGQAQKALTYLNVRKLAENTAEETKLHLSILLANGLISEAFKYQRLHQKGAEGKDLLKHFFLGCQQTHIFHDLLQLPLNTTEYKFLSEYLLNCADSRSPEILVMFNLLRGSPLEAADLNEKLVSQMMERNFKSRERAAARNALVTGFVDALPEEQKKLAQELNQIYSQLDKKEVNPKPLSTKVTNKSLNFISYADLLRDIISKHQEASYSDSTETSPLKTTKTSIQTTPFICSPFLIRNGSRKRSSDIAFATSVPINTAVCADNFMTPSKKSRPFKVSSFKLLDSTDLGGTKASLNSELSSLLQTPPVFRMKHKARSSERTNSVLHPPPHSILKTKSIVEKAPNLIREVYLDRRTPSICSDSEKDEEMPDNVYATTTVMKNQEERDSRQLRFQVPSPENFKSQYQPITNLGRKPLHGKLEKCDSPKKISFTAAGDIVSHLVAERSQTPLILKEQVPDHRAEKTQESFSEGGSPNSSFHLCLSESESEIEKQIDCFVSEAAVNVLHTPAIDSSTVSAECHECVIVQEEPVIARITDSLPEKTDNQRHEDVSDKDTRSIGMVKNYKYSDLQAKPSNIDLISVSNSSKTSEDSEIKISHDTQPIQEVVLHEEAVTARTNALPEKIQQKEKAGSSAEVKQTESNTSPYMGTRSRSRSKSVSPTRSMVKKSPVHSLVKPHKDIQEENSKTKSEKSSSEERSPRKDGSSPLPVEKPQAPYSPYLGTRSRSRSKSISPSRTKALGQASIKFSSTPIKEEVPDVLYVDKMSKNKSSPSKISKKLVFESDSFKASTTVRSSRLDDARKFLAASVSSCLSSEGVTEFKDNRSSQPVTVSSLSSGIETKTSQISTDAEKVMDVSVFLTTENIQSHTKSSIKAQINTEESQKPQQKKSLASSKKKSMSIRGKASTVKKTALARVIQKLEFSFSEPHSSADAEILEALAKSPPTPVASFVFSPPSTRARVRQKKLNETLNASVTSTFSTPADRMFIDPLTYEEKDEFALPPPLEVSSQPRRKPTTKKDIKTTDVSTSRSDTASSDLTSETSKSISRTATRSNRKSLMVLRNSATKKK